MEILGDVEEILNVQERINTGCIAMGYEVGCGVAK